MLLTLYRGSWGSRSRDVELSAVIRTWVEVLTLGGEDQSEAILTSLALI